MMVKILDWEHVLDPDSTRADLIRPRFEEMVADAVHWANKNGLRVNVKINYY
jgi:hypothetical protein